MYEFKKNYKDNAELRQSFNVLAEKTFSLNFEDWYQNGFWRENYIPYSMIQDNKVIANVSVNITDIVWNGTKKHFIQLGTVMTDEAHRNKGLIRMLMEEVEKDYGEKADGMYLFANDSVLEFYPRFGFKKVAEYQYSKQVENQKEATIKQILMDNKSAWKTLEKAINESKVFGSFDMVGNSDLFLFYVTKFMQENVYYDEQLDVYVIAEPEEDTLLIHNVFAKKEIDLEKVIEAFGKGVKKVVLGFVPQNREGYFVEEIEEADTTLFVKGDAFEKFDGEQLMFQILAHA